MNLKETIQEIARALESKNEIISGQEAALKAAVPQELADRKRAIDSEVGILEAQVRDEFAPRLEMATKELDLLTSEVRRIAKAELDQIAGETAKRAALGEAAKGSSIGLQLRQTEKWDQKGFVNLLPQIMKLDPDLAQKLMGLRTVESTIVLIMPK